MDTVELVWVTILAHYGHQQRERAAALAALAHGSPAQARSHGLWSERLLCIERTIQKFGCHALMLACLWKCLD